MANYKYQSKFARIVSEFVAASGTSSDRAIAALLGVSKETVRQWRTYGSDCYKREFAKAITDGKEAVDIGKVKKAMFKRACGYNYKKHITKEVPTEGGILEVHETQTWHVQADVAAAKYVLGNAGADEGRWSDKGQLEHSGAINLDFNKVLAEIDGSGLKPGI